MREAWRKLVMRFVGRLQRTLEIKRDGLSPLESVKLWLNSETFQTISERTICIAPASDLTQLS